ncbi:MAG TPA: thymidine phosphorylase family protein [Pseudomonadales bacterium]
MNHNGTHGYRMQALRIGIDTHEESVLYMRADCAVCRAEGFSSSARLKVSARDRSLIVTLNVVDTGILPEGFVGLSRHAWQQLGLQDNDEVQIAWAPLVSSMSDVRRKIYGHRLDDAAIHGIIRDVADGMYSDIQLASFLTASAGDRMDRQEIVALTRAMVDVGERLHWNGGGAPIYDKHCIGGLPGNRTTPIVVSICSVAGLTIPKTSSRAITSPAGTADTMAVITRVDLDLPEIRRVVEQAGACLVWGGAVRLSPVDDVLIRVERALDLDSEGQLIASVLSKKIAAGSSHILIDIPVGPTAKVRDERAGKALADLLSSVGRAMGVTVRCIQTDGTQPVGNGIGPALEARDVLAVLANEPGAPSDLRDKSLELAAHLLDMARGIGFDAARDEAARILDSGQAAAQFERICRLQGGFYTPPASHFQKDVLCKLHGCINSIDNRKLSRLAKLAGAPQLAEAGVDLKVRCGQRVKPGDCLMTVHSGSSGELEYALGYYLSNPGIIEVIER